VLVTAAEQQPESGGWWPAGSDADGLEPMPTWIGDTVATRRFGSPEQIRAALPPEQVAAFDAAFEDALTAARETLRLDELRRVVQMWRRQALLAERDPEGHRQMLATAAETARTGQPRPGSVPWTALKAELGL
jgi:hypothetical protein